MSGPGPRRATPAARMEKRLIARMPALCRERPKPHAPVYPGLGSSASWRELDFPVPGFRNRTLAPLTRRQARYGPAAGRTSRQAGERIAVSSRETAVAIRGFAEDRAQKNNICGARGPQVLARARNQSSRQRAWEKPQPPKASRHSRTQRRRNPQCSKGRDDDERDRHPKCRTQIRPGRN